MSILVTGGAGFIGSHLIDRLLNEHLEVVCLDDFDDYYDPRLKRENIRPFLKNIGFELIEGDVRDKRILKGVFRGGHIDRIIHLAARAGVRASISQPSLYADVNINGIINLLELCKDFGVESFIFGSSSSVYGSRTNVPFSEDDPTDKQVSSYGATKRAGELLCYTYHHLYDIPITILRFFTVYGPRQRPEMAVHKFTRLVAQSKEIPVYGDGKTSRDYTYISDIIDGTMIALHKHINYEIFNLGSSETIELRFLISLIEKGLGKEARIKRLPEQPGDMPITHADITKSRKVLGYIPKVKIEAGIEKFVDWYLSADRLA
jgi:UDP-glucuronate 4-epimerase